MWVLSLSENFKQLHLKEGFIWVIIVQVFGSVWHHTGPLCPNGNLTFSALPKVRRVVCDLVVCDLEACDLVAVT